MSMKRFPIQGHSGAAGFDIPWAMAERAYVNYDRRYSNGQTLETLAQRGGFGWAEFVLLYCDRNPSTDFTPRVLSRCSMVVVKDLLSGDPKC